jgi:hypothetical protein
MTTPEVMLSETDTATQPACVHGSEGPAIGRFAGFFLYGPADVVLPVCCPTPCDTRLLGQRNTLVYRANGETGATGLELATSGVTGQFEVAR